MRSLSLKFLVFLVFLNCTKEPIFILSLGIPYTADPNPSNGNLNNSPQKITLTPCEK